MSKYISGPISGYRLFNKDTNKTFLLFGDFHSPLTDSNKCLNGIDFTQYIIQTIQNKSLIYDVFIEQPSNISYTDVKTIMPQPSPNQNYISKLLYFLLDLDKQKISNLRIHYIDIRWNICSIFEVIKSQINDLQNFYKENHLYTEEDQDDLFEYAFCYMLILHTLLYYINKFVYNIDKLNLKEIYDDLFSYYISYYPNNTSLINYIKIKYTNMFSEFNPFMFHYIKKLFTTDNLQLKNFFITSPYISDIINSINQSINICMDIFKILYYHMFLY